MSRRGRRRSHRRGSGRKAELVWVGFCLSSLLVALLVTPSASYSVAEFGRQGGVDVAADDGAVVGLQKASSIEEGQESRMVTVANNFGGTDIQLTVELTPPSRGEGNLVVNGTDEGNAYQFTLQPDGQRDVGACFTADENGVPDAATFNVTFSATGSDVSGSIEGRSVPIVDDQTESVDC